MSISIGKRVLLGFVAVTLVLVALGVYALDRIGAVGDTTDVLITRDLAVLRRLDDLANKARDLSIVRRNATIAALTRAQGRAASEEDYPDAWRRTSAEAEALISDLIRTTGEYRARAISGGRATAWERLNAVMTETAGIVRQIGAGGEAQFAAIAARDVGAVEARNDELNRRHEALVQSIRRARDILDGAIAAGQSSVREIYERSRVLIGLTLLAAVVLCVLVTVLISRAVVRPLERIVDFVERVGAGDLTGRVAATGRDEFGRLGETLNGMVSGLADLARTNSSATAELNAAAAEIRASAQEQAASVEEQFAAVQETAATMDQITHSGAQIGKRASEVIAAAQANAKTARAGLRAVSDTAQSMEAIREQGEAVAANIVGLSEKAQTIGEIIATVNDVSERTHLLALNAAIEAAAAGEGGRSFAIVAAEMKLLADQAKGATVQVRAILSEIQRGINASVMLTEEAVKRAATGKSRTDAAERTIESMATSVEESVQTFQQIVASTNQQQLGIEQVMGALQNIRQASQQTAAGTREVEAASANLTELAQALTTLAERYRV